MQLTTFAKSAAVTSSETTIAHIAADAIRFAFLLPLLGVAWLMPQGEVRDVSSDYDRKTEAQHDAAGAFWAYCPGDET